MKKVYIGALENGYEQAVSAGIEYADLAAGLSWGDTVTIKPNLTFPTYRQGVMTNPMALEAVVRHFKNFTSRIVVCESDSGGYNRFSMDAVFARVGINDMAARYGFEVVNLSYQPARPIVVRCGLRRVHVPLPILVLDQTHRFISMPVPKVHLNTGVSLALKNQWGVIQEPSLRLKLHPDFARIIHAVNKALPSAGAVVDGKYGLTRSGPLRGDPVELNWILACNDLFAADYVVTDLMGLDYRRVPYLRYIFRKEGLRSTEGIVMNTDHRRFKGPRFYLRREWTDVPGLLTFHSRFLAYVGYNSVLAKPLHALLYKFREPFF